MEDFAAIDWRIKEVSVLEDQITTDFIKEENITNCLIFNEEFKVARKLLNSNKNANTKNNEPITNLKKCAKYKETSSFNKQQHALCLNALKLIQSGRCISSFTERDKGVINCYNNLKLQIKEENDLFLKYVLKEWNEKIHRRQNHILQDIRSYGENKWKQRFTNVKYYKQYYISNRMLPLSLDEHEVNIIHNGLLLELGSLAEINTSLINVSNKLTTHKFKNEVYLHETLQSTKLPVSKDTMAEKLAAEYGPDIVISSSSLKTLVDNYGPDYHSTWDIPTVVKNLDVKGGNKTIIFIDKPLPKRTMSFVDLNTICRKQLLKSNLHKNLALNQSSTNVDHTEDSGLIIENAENSSSPDKKDSYHNVNYRLWTLQPKDCVQSSLLKGSGKIKEITVLVRCKIDGCVIGENQELKPVTLVPKLEYQWEYGGEIVTKSEILQQWCILIFRPFSNVLRVRMRGTSKDYIMLENCTLNKVISEGLQHYNFTPSIGLNTLYNIFSNMFNLEKGEYILHHSPKLGAFIDLMKGISERTNSAVDLYDLYNKEKCKVVQKTEWHPVDTTLILPNHTACGIMPGLFPPQKNKFIGKKNSKVVKRIQRKWNKKKNKKKVNQSE